MRARTAWLVLGLLALGALAPAAPACSMCRCGDATFNALGTEVFPSQSPLRIALDWDRLDKASAAMDGGGRDEEVEQRVTATVSYTIQERVNLVARLPWAHKRLTEDGMTNVSDGFADPEALVLVRVWAAGFAPGIGRRGWVSLLAGVKTNWGESDARRGGVRLDEHAQPGTGSTDWIIGASGVALLTRQSSLFGSAQYRRTGTNRHGYRYGDVVLVNAGYEQKLGARVDLVGELNYRHAGHDIVDDAGMTDPNSGGGLLYVSPHVSVQLGEHLVARAGVMIPAWRALHGDQSERAAFSVGVTILP